MNDGGWSVEACSVADDGRRRARFGCSIALQSCAGCMTRSSGELRYEISPPPAVRGYRGGMESQAGRKLAFCLEKWLRIRTANVFFRLPNVRMGVSNVRMRVSNVRMGVANVWMGVAIVWMGVANVRMRVANVSSLVANAFPGLANVRRDGESVFFYVANQFPPIPGQSASGCRLSASVSRRLACVAALVKARAGFSRGRVVRTGGRASALTGAGGQRPWLQNRYSMPTLTPWAKKSVVRVRREGLVVLTMGSAWLKVWPFGTSRFMLSPGRITLLK
jgi:hypothetical protein